MRLCRTTIFAFSVLAPAIACADSLSPYEINLGGSTQGISGSFGYRSGNTLGARAIGNYAHLSFDKSFDKDSYQVDATLRSIGVLGDYYPFKGGFRLTGGAFASGNKIEGSASGAVRFNGTTLVSLKLDASLKFNPLTPYLGFGYTHAFSKPGLQLSADIGVLYQGKARLKYKITPGGPLGGAITDEVYEDIRSTMKDLKKSIDDVAQFYPVLSLTIGYRF